MNGPAVAAIRLDLKLQRRYGFYYAALFAIALWIGVLQIVPDSMLGVAMPYVLFGDLQFFFIFIAAAVFFEKGEGTVFALLTTPLRFRHYLVGKLVSMAALAFVTCAVVVLVDYGFGFEPIALLGGVVVATAILVLAGFVSAPMFPSISEWLIPSTLLLAVLNAPVLQYSGLWPHPLFYALPTLPPYLMLGAAFGQVELSGADIAYVVGASAVWIGLLALLARAVFNRFVLAKEGQR